MKTGNPIFSHFVLHPKSETLINKLPFGVTFGDNRKEILEKYGLPTKTNQGEADFFFRAFLVDNYKKRWTQLSCRSILLADSENAQ